MSLYQFAAPLKKFGSRLERRFHRRRYPFLAVPGMMGYEERMNLFQTCQRELTGSGIAIEFGAFLGASTAAIQSGLRANPQLTSQTELHVVDCFRTPLTSQFAEHVRKFSHRGHVGHLLREEDGWLIFYDAFMSHINTTDPHINIHRCFLSDFYWHPEPVEFLHLDLPKDWQQASYVASAVFPNLVVGARVLFQDFGYQWSAELIAMIGHLAKMEFIQPYRITDTTLSVTVEKALSVSAIIALRDLMSTPAGVLAGIEHARSECRPLFSLSIDSIILIAKAQYLYSTGADGECLKIISSVLRNNESDLSMVDRICDLLECNFSMSRSYESV
jgi:hypothetical protein